jgi:recombination protein RecA
MADKSLNGRERALEVALTDLRKRYGDGAIMKLGESTHLHVEAIPTGALSLDIALGVGGVPRGRVIEIYGPESSGKTTLCQHIIAEAQRLGGVAAFIDVEHALDPGYAERCGVDVDNLYISQPDTGEQALEIAEALVRSGAIDVVVIDSVAALVPRAEIEGEMGDAHVGLQARLMSQALRKLSGAVKQSNTALIFTNQLRQKIGVMFGNPETTTGGMALRFYATVRLDMRRVESIKEGGEVTGNRTKVTVKKNKVAPPFKVAEFDIMYNEGISRAGDVLDIAVAMEIVEKRGAFYSYGDVRLGQGRENAKQFLRDTPDLAREIENKVRQASDLPIPGTAPAEVKPAPDEKKIALPPKARQAEVKPEVFPTPEEEELETELIAELESMDGNGEDAL